MLIILIKKFLIVNKDYGFKRALKQTFWYFKTRRYTSRFLSRMSIIKESRSINIDKAESGSSSLFSNLINTSRQTHMCSKACDGSLNPRLSVVIPTIGRSKVLLECLQSIAKSSQKIGLSFEIVLAIDSNANATENDFISEVLNEFSCNSLRVLRHSNFVSGFSEQVNAGVELAIGLDILILNDDTIARENLLEELWDVEWRTVDMIFSPLVLNLDGTIQEIGSTINPQGECEWIGNGQHLSWIENIEFLCVDFASAVCWLMNRNRFRETGGFSSFAGQNYYEDSKFALNPANGFRTYVITGAQVVHYLSQSSNPGEKMLVVNEVTRHLFREWWRKCEIPNPKKLKVMALYLPQFHSTDYNDLWWGVGYTEWSALGSWEQQIQEQPKRLVPSELGFYDLIDKTVLEKQSILASDYGVDAFVIMTYWFNGTKLLDKPLENFLVTDLQTDFCLFWANESWSRKWDGQEEELLMKQTHNIEDSKSFISAHRQYLAHPRYVKIRGKKVIFIYRRELFANAKANLDAMRQEAIRLGLGELYFVAFESFEQSLKRDDPTLQGFDAAAEYPPHGVFPGKKYSNFESKVFTGRSHDYKDVENFYLGRQLPKFPLIRSVMVGFDNTSRMKNKAIIFQNSDYSSFLRWFRLASKNSMYFGDSTDNWVIVNAWNEWSESAVLEPSIATGRDYLAAVKIVKDSLNELNVDIRHE
jgi:GT2 family glycosyltransferase